MLPAARERFAQLVSGPEEELDLAEAALLIAQEEHPELDVAAYLRRLDGLAAAVRARLPEAPEPTDIIHSLNIQLFGEEGLAGNESEYYDPRNSFLNEVLDRKRGIPITLSVIYLEVGRRLGLPLAGVGFPGHFLVKYSGADGELVLDPFAGGVTLSREELAQKLRRMYGDANPFLAQIPQLLAPASKKEILLRMLHNLKGIYLQQNDFTRALAAIDRRYSRPGDGSARSWSRPSAARPSSGRTARLSALLADGPERRGRRDGTHAHLAHDGAVELKA